jgi:Asp/Glu/hydantoin racemase
MQTEKTAIGGKTVYGASVGILMLDTLFPRLSGDIGNATTFPFPVHYKIVRGASPDLVVRQASPELLGPFIDAAKELEQDGVDGIATTCGFLALFQDELSAAVSIPVITSSLMQVPLAERMLPASKRAGILTISATSLTERHLEKAGVRLDTPIGSTEGGREFTRAVLNNETSLHVDLARQDNVDAARQLVARHPEVGAIILECTNMSPYAADIHQATGLPVFSVLTLINWLQAGLVPRRY